MSESMLLTVAIFVFAMMVIGLGLTIWEFRAGQPRREDEQARAMQNTRAPGLTDADARPDAD